MANAKTRNVTIVKNADSKPELERLEKENEIGGKLIDKETLDQSIQEAQEETGTTIPEQIGKVIEDNEPEWRKKTECPFAKNGKVNIHKRFAPPMCNCGGGHVLINRDKYFYRFVLPADVENLKVQGYKIWTHPHNQKAYTCGTQVLMVIAKGIYKENKEAKRNKFERMLTQQKEGFEGEARKRGTRAFGPGYEKDRFK